MFGIGPSELLVICCVALVFIRPKDLPAVLGRLGRLYARLRASCRELSASRDQILDELRAAADRAEAMDLAASPRAAADRGSPGFPEPEAGNEGIPPGRGPSGALEGSTPGLESPTRAR
ncbi:MAG TPA: hypothetical protein PLB91_01290 [Spirochaetales bacterium]|nr:hypothetical protein [Spirochaetales bacterium]HRY54912.1 hypothetical protein [Spirochaetia bacterium]HRZ63499.1 hypothetical protein [Spirochaetia bacterium]